jgi:hypothetical protein
MTGDKNIPCLWQFHECLKIEETVIRHILFSVLSQRANVVNKESRFWTPNMTECRNLYTIYTYTKVCGLQFFIYAQVGALVKDRTTGRQRTRYLCFSRYCSLDLRLKRIFAVDSLHIQWNCGLMYKWGSVEELCVENIVTDENYLFRSFCSLVTFEIIQNSMQLCIDTKEDWNIRGKNVVYVGNFEIIDVGEILKVSVSACFSWNDSLNHRFLKLANLWLKDVYLCLVVNYTVATMTLCFQ